MPRFGLLGGDLPGLLGRQNPIRERFPLASAAAQRYGDDPNSHFSADRRGPQGPLGLLGNITEQSPIKSGLGAGANAILQAQMSGGNPSVLQQLALGSGLLDDMD